MAQKSGLPTRLDTVAELGPGESLGTGLAALLSGAHRYYALDVVPHSETSQNLAILDELVELFQRREDIPDNAEFPSVKPIIDSYAFPRNILSEELLENALHWERIASLRKDILAAEVRSEQSSQITYFVSWNDSKVIKDCSIDMVYSQACMEHVDDLQITYQALYRWLKPGGFMSHEIDFRSHRTTREWNGHWAYSDLVWRLIRGARPYFLNRQPLSTHLEHMLYAGFQIVSENRYTRTTGIGREELAPRFANISDLDLATGAAFIQSVK